MVQSKRCLFLVCLFGLADAALAADWPQFLGPNRNGVYVGTDLAEAWPKDGPPVIWQRAVGEGYAGPVIVDTTLVLFHRLGNEEVVEGVDTATGKSIWSFSYPTHFRDGIRIDNGPRATPTVAEGRVYTFGPEGMLHCLDLSSGRKIWGLDARKGFALDQKWHGMAGSPLVESNAVLLNIGGTNNASTVAFEKNTGRVLWQNGHDKFSCASPVAAVLNGRRQILFVTRASFRTADLETGETLFKQPWRSRDGGSVNAASPMVIGDLVFISAGYGLGGQLWRATGSTFESVWQTQEFANQYTTSIHHDGYLYGVHGQRETSIDLRCVELKTGRVQWTESGFGPATLLLSGRELLILTYNGELIRAAASPTGFLPRQRAQILPFGARAYPAIADGRLYARSTRKMVCVDLRQK